MALTDKIIRIIKNGVGCLVLAATLYAQDFTISYNKIIQNAKLEKVYCNALLFSKNDAICGDIYSILFFKCKDKSYFFFRFSDDFKEIKEIQYSTNINFFVKEKNINYNSKVLLKYKIPTEIFQVEADALWFENNRKHEFNIN